MEPLVGRDEAIAKDELLRGVQRGRVKPSASPVFPGGPLSAAARQVPQKPRFPVATHNLPPANPDFVGREEVLAELHRLLTSGQGPTVITQTITGLGGIGKTQTALAYAYRHLADYRLVWWLRAESNVTLATDFTTLAEPLDLDPTTADQDKLLKEIRGTLQVEDDWLLILDNVEDPELPRTYLPTTGSGHVLITSRCTDWHGIAKPLPLEVMPEAEALQLLTGRPDPELLPPADLAEAKVLASDLGYFPLALAQAHVYMAETGKSFAGYLRLFRDSRPRVLDRKIRDYPASVAKTWQISIEAAAHVHPAAQSLLELLAFFAPDALPVKVLDIEPAILSEELQDEFERDKAIAALNRFSLIRAQAGTITVHRLVQAVTHDGLNEAIATARAKAAVQLVKLALLGRPQDPANWPIFGAFLPHALVVAETAERRGAGLEPAVRILNAIGLYHWARAAWTEAAPLLQRALAISEAALGPKHPYAADSLNNLALLYQAQGRLDEAEPLFQRALTIRETVLGPKHPYAADSLNNLALLYQAQGRLGEAEPLFQRALAIYEKALGPDHPDTANSLNNLARLYRDQGRLGEAEPLFQRALAISEAALGPEHPYAAQSLNNLAGLYQAQGRLGEAAPLYQRALAIYEKALGPKHPYAATSLNNLAGLYRDQGRLGEAEPLFQRALTIRETVLGPKHPDTRTVRERLAELRQRLSALPPDHQPPK